jgi:hypothetical protein
MRALICCAMLLTMAFSSPFVIVAQVRFEVSLTVTNGTNGATLYFGFFPGAHYCFHPADTINGHGECGLPPPPPAGVFDVRFLLPRGVGLDSGCCAGGSSDFRPFISAAQRDTFKVKSQFGTGTNIVLSWPAGLSAYFTHLTLRYFDQVLQQNVNIDMLRDTTADVTDAGYPATVYIFSGGLVLTSVGETSHSAPDGFSLNQNYPNPFNPETNFQFSIANCQLTILKVYDVLGREVSTLVNEVKQPGAYTVQWDASGVASGVYFYRLHSDDATITRKMLLIR